MKTLEEIKDTHRPVIVGTDRHGLHFGYVPIDGPSNKEMLGANVELLRARTIIYRNPACRGVEGLAETGPVNGCKIGGRANIAVGAVTGVVDVQPVGAAAMEDFEWAP